VARVNILVKKKFQIRKEKIAVLKPVIPKAPKAVAANVAINLVAALPLVFRE